MKKSSNSENKRVTRIKKILELEKIKQINLADALEIEPQNFSRFMVSGKVSEKTCRKIVAIYPKYRIEWLLGYDDYMTIDDVKAAYQKQLLAMNRATATIIDDAIKEVCLREGIEQLPTIDNPAEYLFLEAQLRDFADSIVWNYLKHRKHSHLWQLLDHDPDNPE